ncbi:hypothetical protein AeMF1_017469 [Aphanomyces euteiches]|nr:hypothetical protein AeMF1_017469 [Aphanomyces euteiches]
MDEMEVNEEPREVAIEDIDVGSLYGRVLKWSDLGINLQADKFNAVSLTLEALCQQELQLHLRAVINGNPWSYEFLCGGQGNTEASVLKRGVKGKEVDVACVFCGRLCSDSAAGQYWFQIALHRQNEEAFVQISLGIGGNVGDKVVLVAKDDLNDKDSTIHLESVGITSGRSPLKARNISLRSQEGVSVIPSDTVLCVMSDPSGTDLLTAEQRADFTAACESAKRRADRFGGTYHPPDVKQFLDSKVVRMMQRSGAVSEKGFATGFDVMSSEETAKREARRQRFNLTMDYDIKAAREISNGATEEEIRKHQEEVAKRANRAAKFGVEDASNLESASPKVLAERVDLDESLELRQDALHMYSLDESFTSVRTRDILAYFLGYGPSYVEWINDSSCTIVFDDPFTVSRALLSLTTEIPAEATLQRQQKEANPFQKPEEAAAEQSDRVLAKGWRLGLPIQAADHMDRTWRILLRRATLKDFPPEKTWKRQLYQKSSHRRMQRLPNKRKRREDDGDSEEASKGKKVRDEDME